MAVERVLGTENNPDIIESGSAVEIIPEQSRSEAISESDNILVMDDEVLLDEQIAAELANMENETEDFFDNLAEFVDENELSKLASNLIDSIHGFRS
jgi:hypothetical protein